MSSPQDLYSYYAYSHVHARPSTTKASRLVHAAATNNVDNLRELLDTPEWYNTTDRNGLTLLQCTMETGSIEAFDYLVSLLDLNTEFAVFRDVAVQTALYGAFHARAYWLHQYFVCELIKRGAVVDAMCHPSRRKLVNLLYYALQNSYPDVVFALLEAGAEPCISHFESSVEKELPPLVQEILFLYTFDEYTTIQFKTLCLLARCESPLFHEIVKYPDNVVLGDWRFFKDFCYFDLSIGVNYLTIIVKNFSKILREIVGEFGSRFWVQYFHSNKICFERLNVLMESELKYDVISAINDACYVPGSGMRTWLICYYCYSKEQILEIYLYLLSYGLVLNEWDMQYLYKLIGYTEMFKIFLHMDIELRSLIIPERRILANFLYDINMDLEKLLQDPPKLSLENINELLDHFAHPQLTRLDHSLTLKTQMPRLVELARNVFRKYIVKKFEVKNTSQFYTILKHLPISTVHEKIITFETKLY